MSAEIPVRSSFILLQGLDKYAERAAGRPAASNHVHRDFKVIGPFSYRYSMSEPSFESDLPEALDRSLSSFPEVKAEQTLMIEKVVNGRDVFAQVPTGSGKSSTFQILPHLCGSLKTETHNATNRCDASPRQVAATNRLL